MHPLSVLVLFNLRYVALLPEELRNISGKQIHKTAINNWFNKS